MARARLKKRILQFIGSFHQGGTERQAVALTKMLKNEGSFDVFAATLNGEGVLLADISIDLPEIPEFPLTSFYNANFVTQVRRCAKYLRDNEIDLVHTHDFYTNVFGIAAAALAGIECRIASKREIGGMRSRSQEFVEKLAFNRAKAIVVNSGAVREHLIQRSIPPDQIHLIYNGLNLGLFGKKNENPAALPGRLGLPASENIKFITLVANLRHAVKNVPMLLRAAKSVVEKKPDTHFVIAGEGEFEAELRTLASELGVAENVHFIGRCTDIPALLAVSDICVLTSTAEGFSNSILEYMAAGKPVVATNVGGAGEAIMDGESGYLIKSDDDAAMAERLIALLEDEEKAVSFGAEGKRIANEKFSQETQLMKTIELYNSFLA